MSVSPGFVAWKLANQISPIILTRGIATSMGGALPIVALTEGANFLASLLTGGLNIELDGFFANYTLLPGGTIINNQVAMYPFANQSVAANAIIAQPLQVSMLMQCPAQGRPAPSIPGIPKFSLGGLNLTPTLPSASGYLMKLATMIALQNSLSQHNNSGGTYSVITPSFIYTDCIMTGMRDVSGDDSKQIQYAWQMDFVQTIVSIQAAQSALNGLMQKLTNGTAITGTPTWSFTGLGVGNPVNLITSSVVPTSLIASPSPSLQ